MRLDIITASMAALHPGPYHHYLLMGLPAPPTPSPAPFSAQRRERSFKTEVRSCHASAQNHQSPYGGWEFCVSLCDGVAPGGLSPPPPPIPICSSHPGFPAAPQHPATLPRGPGTYFSLHWEVFSPALYTRLIPCLPSGV